MPEVTDVVAQAYAERKEAWGRARRLLRDWLRDQARDLLEGQDSTRIDVAQGRIKKRKRTCDKLRRRIEEGVLDAETLTPRDVEQHVRDVVGLKVLCKSTRDQRMLADRLVRDQPAGMRLSQPPKDYVSKPKPSGYRAIHLEYLVQVPGHDDVAVEVQIKTRLQDAWSELTHEDLYKPGAPIKVTPFHESVALTMANLLAEVDRLADNLAEELASTIEEPVLVPEAPAGTVRVRVRTTGPRFALAVDEHGRQGLIQASAVRRLAGVREFIDVADYLHVDDELTVRVVDGEKGLYYVPTELPRH